MDHITAVVFSNGQAYLPRLLHSLTALPLIKKILVVDSVDGVSLPAGCEALEGEAFSAGDSLHRIFAETDTPYLLFLRASGEIQPGPGCLSRFLEAASTTRAGMLYSDYWEIVKGERREHPVNDYQPGSIRDDFDFGALTLLSLSSVRDVINRFGSIASSVHAGFYDLRLKLSQAHALYHIRECLYTVSEPETNNDGLAHFSYLDPRHHAVQKKMEGVVTDYLKRIGAYLNPDFTDPPPPEDAFPAEASVVIPVRNRKNTIADAVRSALSQETDFPFNVLVVDNHSDDGTTELLDGMARSNPNLRHIIPSRYDLTIGGCWNEAVFSAACGRYAVQLDSDDLYSSPHALGKIVALLRSGRYAMAIGSYTLVNARLEEIPPGLIDHREWTEENGRNNALRINGLGAPRAFNTAVLRKWGFLNVGYGEDYAAALRLSREYRIGRIYENLYFCRRWEGNTDAVLTVAQRNRNDAFKDSIRTLEIMARQEMNRQKGR